MGNEVKKRAWVKNAAIIFLAVLLVLTLFSNTFRNRTLPEVATMYVQSGSISAQIRGSGTVTATENFEVVSDQSRKILSVPVKVGDTVAVGDTLVIYSEADATELKAAQDALDDLQLNYQKALINSSSGKYSAEKSALTSAGYAVTDANNAQAIATTAVATATTAVSNAEASVAAAQKAYDDAKVGGDDDDIAAKKEALDIANGTLDSAMATLAEKNTALTDAKNTVTQAQRAYKEAELALEKAVKLENLDLTDMKKGIAEQQKVVDDLKSGSVGAEVKSQVNGVVASISVSAGNQATPDVPLMVVEVPDLGYMVSFSVTKEQAEKLRMGDEATIQSGYYWGATITANLTAIKTDTQNPATNKILSFKINGDVTSGSQVTLSIGERGKNYDTIVPNSAIRSDSNGKFVLAVMAKNSALGNRYVATRIDINVLATDDVNSAISGALTYGDIVITQSSKPIETGMQVRLPD